MGFKLRSTAELIQIARAGGGFGLDAGLRSTAELIQIARAGSDSGAKIIFRGLSLRSTAELIQIGRAGKGCVTFED